VKSSPAPPKRNFASFHFKVLVAMMLVVSVVTAISVILAQRNVAATVKRDLEHQFQSELASFHAVQLMRQAALAERSRALARKSRIHAALEDNALDLLYPSARDELLDVRGSPENGSDDPATGEVFHARFYRFLGGTGAVIRPTDTQDAGALTTREESQLALPSLPVKIQTGYLLRPDDPDGETIDEIIAMPIASTENGGPVGALVLGFKPVDLPIRGTMSSTETGIWSGGQLYLPAMPPAARLVLATEISRALAVSHRPEQSFPLTIDGAPSLVFYRQLNPESPYPAAYEVGVYSLTDSMIRQRRLFWQFTGAGVLLLIGAFVASHFLSVQLAVPVEKLAVDSEENRTQRKRAEEALELTHEELQRSARFSADASHQLKTPVTVLRAGLEELLAGETLSAEVRSEVSSLVHQTFRLTSVIEDLLLLSRMDAGRLQLDFQPVNLSQLIEGWLDDLGALPDSLAWTIETDFAADVLIEGEKRFTTLILQNLLENARKYNRTGGRIKVTIHCEEKFAILVIGNTGPTIPPDAKDHIFQRFYRGAMGENLPGHGLGLNLARELVRLHQGELRLVGSDNDWTEFETRFVLAGQIAGTPTRRS
jgi:signal transduction histidine kinase